MDGREQQNLNILIPISPYYFLSKEVLSGILTIPFPYKVFIHSTEPTEDKVKTIVNTRNSLRRCNGSKYCLLLDSDVILEDWAIPLLVDTMDKNTEIGMCGISTRLKVIPFIAHPHVNLSCALIKGYLLSHYPFRYSKDNCECILFNKDLTTSGWKVTYASDKILREVNE